MTNISVLVLNLATGAEQTYINMPPLDALISAAITASTTPENLTNPLTRKRYLNKVIYGKHSASIGDFAVKL